MILLLKIMFTALFKPPKQDFVNDLWLHEQRRHYRRHAGIEMKIPPSKYFPEHKRR